MALAEPIEHAMTTPPTEERPFEVPAAPAAAIDAGVAVLRRGGPAVFRKVLITGVGRSGTTAVSALFGELGYHRGDALTQPFGEDEAFRRLLMDLAEERLAEALERWAGEHERVAWKDPKIFASQGHRFVRRLPDDWLLIAVFRDPLAVAQRRVLSDGVELLPAAAHVARYQSRLIEFVGGLSQSAALVSYERLMQSPAATLDRLLPLLARPVGHPDAAGLWRAIGGLREAYRRHADPSHPREALP